MVKSIVMPSYDKKWLVRVYINVKSTPNREPEATIGNVTIITL